MGSTAYAARFSSSSKFRHKFREIRIYRNLEAVSNFSIVCEALLLPRQY